VRHEQTTAYAADGYARASGRVGVALTTTGPGAANTLGALGEAWASRQPVVVIATDIPTRLRRPGVWRGVLHEVTDQAAMFAPVTKETIRVSSAAEVGPAIDSALVAAASPPMRPVYVELPTDLLEEPVSEVPESASPPAATPDADNEHYARAAEIVEGSRRPLIWAGGGALQSLAGEEIGRLAERLVAPVLLTYSAAGLLAPGHPCLVEAPPHAPEVGALWDEADVVVAIGTDFDGMMTQAWRQPPPPRLVAINVDPADASKNYLPDVLLEADAALATERFPMHTRWPDMLPKIEQMVRDADAGTKSVRDALTTLDAELETIAKSG
jgi:acetolactate synthase-1/2/3 large subunit